MKLSVRICGNFFRSYLHATANSESKFIRDNVSHSICYDNYYGLITEQLSADACDRITCMKSPAQPCPLYSDLAIC